MPRKSKRLFSYLLIHFALLVYGAFISLLFSASNRLGGGSFCLSHDLLRIYCPFCGGTRALFRLLQLKPLSALRFHAALVLTLPFLLLLDVRALCLILRDRSEQRLFPKWAWIFVGSVFVLYFIVRNVLLLGFGVDFAGDFQ